MRQGQLSYSKVRALTRVATPANEARLLDCARCATAAQVERLTRAWQRVDRQAEADADRLRHEGRELQTWVDDDGMVVVRGRLAPEVGAVVRQALEAAADRLRAEVSPDEAAETSTGQRRADALGLVAESALAGGLDRGTAGDRYQVVLHVEPEALQAVPPADAGGDGGRQPAPAPDAAGPAEAGAVRVSAETPRGSNSADAHGAASRSGDEAAAAGTGGQERAEAAAEADAPACGCGGTVGAGAQAACPRSAAPAAHAALEDADGLRVSAETSRRLACDAALVVMRHAGDGAVLDVGRRTRTVPPALRRALEARDRRCRFPGCQARRCDVHHIEHWATAGRRSSRTWCGCAGGTIGRCTRRGSRCAWGLTARPSSAGRTGARCRRRRPPRSGRGRRWRRPRAACTRPASASARTRRPRPGAAAGSTSATRSTCCGPRAPTPGSPRRGNGN